MKLVVVGGGIAGLAAAHRAVEYARERGRSLTLTLLEAAPRLGGRLVGTNDRMRRNFVVFGGRLHPLPDGFQLLAPTRFGPFLRSRLFSWPGKLRMALDLVLPRGGNPDESLGAFVRRRLGRQALERVAQPLVAGIYTADPDEPSLAATMPRF